MADESSSIALQLAINLRGLTKLTQLNTALKELRSNAASFQRQMTGSTQNLKNLGAGATTAARGMRDLQKAQAEASRKFVDALGRDIAAIKKKDAALAASKAKLESAYRQKDPLGSDISKYQAKAAAKTAAARTRAEQMYATMFDQLEQKTVRSAAAASKRIESETARMHARRAAAGVAAARKMAAADEREARKVSSTLKVRLTAWEEHYDAIFRAGFRLQMVGNDLKQMGMVGINALRGISDEFANFEFMVNRATGAVGLSKDTLDGGASVYNRFTEAIQETAQELRFFKPEEVAKATYFWASTTGQQVETLEDLEAVMRSVNPLMKIAAMTETDYETAIKGVYSILVQYSMGLDRAQEVTEKLHMVTQRTAAEFPDLVNSFKMVGPVAKEFGVTFDDMVILLGRLADAGIRGTMSGRAFRQFFIQISRPAPKATAALDDLWESTEKFGDKSYLDTVFPAGEFIGVNNYVNELAMRLQDATDKERMFTLATITTANELPVLTALVSRQIGVIKGYGEAWDGSKEDLSKAAASFADSWEQLRTSWKGTLGALTRGVEIIRLKVGKQLADILAPTFEKFVEVLIKVRKWFENANNGPIVEFATRLFAIASAGLVVAGSIAVFGGALVGLVAVLKVVYGAFSPLFKAFSVAGGLVATLAIAFVRNFDYIRDTALEVFNTLSNAMKGSEDSINSLIQIFVSVSTVVGFALDTVIRVIGEFVKILAHAMAWVIKFEPAMIAIGAAANALAFIISARLLIGIAMLAKEMLLGATASVMMKTGLMNLIIPTKLLGGKGPGGIAGLVKSFLPLTRAGAVGVGLAAVAVGVGLLYTTNENFRGSVDRLIFDWVTGLDEVIAKANEAQASMGMHAPRLDEAVTANPEYKAIEGQIKYLEQLAEQEKGPFQVRLFGFTETERALDNARKQLAQFKTDSVQTITDAVDQMNERWGSDVTVEQYLTRLAITAQAMGKTITDVDVERATSGWFVTALGDAKKMNERAIELIGNLELAASGPTAKLSDIFGAQMAKTELIGLTAGGALKEEIAEAARQAINGGMVEGTNLAEPPVDELKSLWDEYGSAVVSTSKELVDIDKRIGEALEEEMKPSAQVGAVFESYLTGWISKGFRTADGHFHVGAAALASDATQDLFTQFQTYQETMPPADFKDFVWDTMVQFKQDFTDGIPDSVTPEQRTLLVNYMSMVYTSAGKDMPQWAIDMFTAEGVAIPGYTADGVREGLPVVKAAGAAMPTALIEGIDSKTGAVRTAGEGNAKSARAGTLTYTYANYKSWGSEMGRNFARGLTASGVLVYNAANGLAMKAAGPLKHTTPSEGPLKDDDMWGIHLGENLAMGMAKSVPKVHAAAMQLASAASLAQDTLMDPSSANMSYESSSNRIIKVQVEVTSPDGSVDRVKAAELERGLMTSDLILSIEHMSTVG